MKQEPQRAASGSSEPGSLSSLAAISMPWVFTQRNPLKLGDFISEAKRRGFDLDVPTMRELYRHGLLVPFVAIYGRRVPGQPDLEVHEPAGSAGTLLQQVRKARSNGRIEDLALTPFKPHLPFERGKQKSPHWWNGLIYSWYQLQFLPELRETLQARRRVVRGQRTSVRLPVPDPYLLEQAARSRRIAIVATALEARYLPSLDPEWTRVHNVKSDVWDQYRSDFDPARVSNQLSYSGAQADEDAVHLLSRVRRIDPVGGRWSKLIRRAPRSKWGDLKDAALLAMDMRETAEILLLFYQDLAALQVVEPLPEIPPMSWHPLRERLSDREGTLDQDLMNVGLSPHPRVVLAVEGESEEVHAPRVWKALGYPDAPELMRFLKLGGVDKNLQKVAALAAAPLIAGRKTEDTWELIKPPTCLMVAVDPEGRYFAPNKVDATRQSILNEIKSVLKAQGAKTTDKELDHLVKIRTWSESCYEFAHFTDDELADGIRVIHQTSNNLTRDELIASLAEVRARRGTKNEKTDIKAVWERWSYKPSKVDLARELWPVLQRKIDQLQAGENVTPPEIVEVVEQAYFTAQSWRHETFVLTAS